MWNVKPQQVQRLSELADEDDEQTIVRSSRVKPPIKTNPSDDEKSVRAIALLVAIVLSAVLALWRDPESMLWWLLAFLALSSWCCALGSFVADVLKVAIEWIVEAFAYLRGLLANWRDAAGRFIDRWIWSRFRAKQKGGESDVEHV
jgi:hypothetical protein